MKGWDKAAVDAIGKPVVTTKTVSDASGNPGRSAAAGEPQRGTAASRPKNAIDLRKGTIRSRQLETGFASADEQRAGYRTDWHERQIPKGAVLVDSSDNRYVYEYEMQGNRYQVTVNVKLLKS